MSAIAIAGVGTTGYLREQAGSPGALAARAVSAALDDAGLSTSDVDGLITEAGLMPKHLPEDLLAQACNIQPEVSLQWLVGAAGTVGAPRLARMAIEGNQAEVIVVVQVMGGTGARRSPYAYHAEDPIKSAYEMPMGWYGQAVYFAAMAQRYAHQYGLPQGSLGQVAIEARRRATDTPGAQRIDQMDMDGYLSSRLIAEPLRSPDCSLISEGATAYVITSKERARDLRRPTVEIMGTGVARSAGNQSTWFTQRGDHLATGAELSGEQAYAEAGIGPGEVDLVQLYDCFTISPLLQMEDLRLCARGEAAERAMAGEFRIDGRLPMNTHGGLLSYGFCLGIGHVVEAVRQLRGERGAGQVPGVETALVGGLGVPHHSTMILAKGE